MEVHPHPHSEGKRLKHYLFEFLMLFLAVFAAFIAENLREHYTEHKKAREYISSMIEDLKQDTSMLNLRIIYYNNAVKGIDTILDILEQPSLNDSSVLKLYLLNNFATNGFAPAFSQRTLAQLKNSGGLRLIHNKLISDTISIYDNNITFQQGVLKSIDEQTTTNSNFGTIIFDNRYYRNYNIDSLRQVISMTQSFSHLLVGKNIPHLLTTNPLTLRQYANYAAIVQGVDNYNIVLLTEQKQLATRLIQLMRKEYHHLE